MHTKEIGGFTVHHNSDWSGDVVICRDGEQITVSMWLIDMLANHRNLDRAIQAQERLIAQMAGAEHPIESGGCRYMSGPRGRVLEFDGTGYIP